jgi:hypothetical protein
MYRKGRPIMKTKKHYTILALAAVILCVSALGEVKLPLPEDNRPVLIGRPNPELTGIEQLYVVIVRLHSRPDEDGLLLKKLEQSVRHKLKDANITVAEDDVDKINPDLAKVLKKRLNSVRNLKFRSANIPELRVDIEMLKLKGSQQYVFRIQTSVARAVCLSREYRPLFKANVWKTGSPMQAISVKNMPAVVTDAVLEQVDAFIAAYCAANPPGARPSATNDITVKPEKLTKPDAKRAVAEYKYVASKNSKVFHKPDCRWVKRIKPANLVGYNSRGEAIEAGKRPCKMCKP